MMKTKTTWAALGVLFFAATAGAQDLGSIFEMGPKNQVAHGARLSSDGRIDVLLKVRVNGIQSDSWVMASFDAEVAGNFGHTAAAGMTSWRVSFSPIALSGTMVDRYVYEQGRIEFLPTEISGDIRLSVNQSISIHAVGVRGSSLRDIGDGKFFYVAAAVKALGAKIINYLPNSDGDRHFAGMSLVSLSAEIGQSLYESDEIVISLGGGLATDVVTGFGDNGTFGFTNTTRASTNVSVGFKNRWVFALEGGMNLIADGANSSLKSVFDLALRAKVLF